MSWNSASLAMQEKVAERKKERKRVEKQEQLLVQDKLRAANQMRDLEGMITGAQNLATRIQARTKALRDTAGDPEEQSMRKIPIDFVDNRHAQFNMTGKMKKNHADKPLWVCPDGMIFLEAGNLLYKQAYDFLVAIAEPVSRPEFIHEYKLTPYSLFAAVSVAMQTEDIIDVLQKLSKNELCESVTTFIRESTSSYGKLKLVLRHNTLFIETAMEYKPLLLRILQDPDIAAARVHTNMIDLGGASSQDADGFLVRKAEREDEENMAYKTLGNESGGGVGDVVSQMDNMEDELEEVADMLSSVSFQIDSTKVEQVKKACLMLDAPLVEEYDHRRDNMLKDVPGFNLKHTTGVRPYQAKSLSKMFGNGRARSGVIVLPCGAGKTLVAVTAASTIKKSCLCLCTSAVSVEQFKHQFRLWSNLPEERVARFTSDNKDDVIHPECGVVITTYSMMAYSGSRAEGSDEIMQLLEGREWGLLLMDEVHVVPANTFRDVLSRVRCHCKLGLSATLVREDDKIEHLNFLIGPKLYEANWMDLTKLGYLAKVQCIEVWCPMYPSFMREYLKGGQGSSSSREKQLLYINNPNKFLWCEFLKRYHEARGDKIIMFCDNVSALLRFSDALKIPRIYGATGQADRELFLGRFKSDPPYPVGDPMHGKGKNSEGQAAINTIMLSAVGDTSIDIPNATVLIQIASHYGSRRQEAQRLGRILRPKLTGEGGGIKIVDGNTDAWFYSLLSTDTKDLYYSIKRRQYLINQGYTYKVLTKMQEATEDAVEKGDLTPEEDTALHLESGRRRAQLLQLWGSADESLRVDDKHEAAEDKFLRSKGVGGADDLEQRERPKMNKRAPTPGQGSTNKLKKMRKKMGI